MAGRHPAAFVGSTGSFGAACAVGCSGVAVRFDSASGPAAYAVAVRAAYAAGFVASAAFRAAYAGFAAVRLVASAVFRGAGSLLTAGAELAVAGSIFAAGALFAAGCVHPAVAGTARAADAADQRLSARPAVGAVTARGHVHGAGQRTASAPTQHS